MPKKLIIVFLFMFMPVHVFAAETDTIIKRGIEAANIDIIDKEADEIFDGFDFKGTVIKLLSGEYKVSYEGIKESLIKILSSELSKFYKPLQSILLIGIMSSVFKNLNELFGNEKIGELGYNVCYMALVAVIAATFSQGLFLVRDVLSTMSDAVAAVIPAFAAVVVSSGNATFFTLAGPIIIMAAEVINNIMSSLILPVISGAAAIDMLNHLTEKEALKSLVKLMKDAVSLGLRGGSMLFVAVLSIFRIGIPPINMIIGKTAKAAVDAVPVVGDVMSGAVESAGALISAIGGSALAAAVIFIGAICFVPVVKLIAIVFMYKLTAALLEPICGSRIAGCINTAGDFSMLLLGTLVSAAIMFMFSVIIMAGAA